MTRVLHPLREWGAKLLGRRGSKNTAATPQGTPQGTLAGSRLYLRHQVRCTVAIFWKDSQGRNRSARARGLDASELGLLVEMSEALPLGFPVFLDATKLQIMGSAYVRHCQQKNGKYQVGLEFQNPVSHDFASPAPGNVLTS